MKKLITPLAVILTLILILLLGTIIIWVIMERKVDTVKEWSEIDIKALTAKQYDEAIIEYKKAIKTNPNDADAHLNLGHVYCEKKMEYAGAYYLYKAGLLFLKQGNRELALKAYEGLKLTKSKKLEEALFKQLYPEVK
jgi:tetratricopeptide (TPR) repeat protein